MTFAQRRAIDFLRRQNGKKRPKEISFIEGVQKAEAVIEHSLIASHRAERAYQNAVRILQERFSKDLPFLTAYHESAKPGAARTKYSRIKKEMHSVFLPRQDPYFPTMEQALKVEHSKGIVAGASIQLETTHPGNPPEQTWSAGEPSRPTEYGIVRTQESWQSCDPAYQIERLIEKLNAKPDLCNDSKKWRMFADFASDYTTEKDGVWTGRSWFDFNTGRNPDLLVHNDEPHTWWRTWHQPAMPPREIRAETSYREIQAETLYRTWAGLPQYDYLLSWAPRSYGTVDSVNVEDDPDPSLEVSYKHQYGQDSSKERMGQYLTLRGVGGVPKHMLRRRETKASTWAEAAFRKYNEVVDLINTPIRNAEPLTLRKREKVSVWLRLPGRDLKYKPFRYVTDRARLTVGNNWAADVDTGRGRIRTMLVSSLDWPKKSERKLAERKKLGRKIPGKLLHSNDKAVVYAEAQRAEALVLSVVPETVDFKSYVPADCRAESGHWNDVGITKDTKISLLSPTHMRHSHYHLCDREARFCTAEGQHVLSLTAGVILLDS